MEAKYINLENDSIEVRAAREFLRLRDRLENPSGSFDNGGRWYSDESCDCCKGIRSPSRAFPYSQLVHCRTLKHICCRLGVDIKAVKKELVKLEPRAKKESNFIAYKAVAVTKDGELRSIYDGVTRYDLGQQLVQTAKSEHGGGFYVYSSVTEAVYCDVPERSKLKDYKRAILECKVDGRKICYDNGKMAYSRITPTSWIMSII